MALACQRLLLVAALLVGCSPGPQPGPPRPPRPSPPPVAAAEAEPGEVAEPEPEPEPEVPGVTIAASGDVVVSKRLSHTMAVMGEGAFGRMLEGFSTVLDEDEVATLNLETPLVDDEVSLSTGWPPVLGSPPGVAEALAGAGVDLVSFANNHSYDQGHAGVARTMALLDEAGVAHAGAGTSAEGAFAARILERNGLRIAFIAATSPMNRRPSVRGTRRYHVARLWDQERLFEAVEAAREQADLVVAWLHWSRDFAEGPNRRQRALARRLIDAGVDLILGAGPHVIHPVERVDSPRGEAVIAYSLGNLLSTMAFLWQPGDPVATNYVHPSNVMPTSRDGVLLRVSFEVPERGRVRVASLRATPLWTENTTTAHYERGVPLRVRVLPLAAAPEAAERERRPRIAEALGDQVELVD